MSTLLLKIAYSGTQFSGFARQDGQRTVEEVVQGALVAVDPGCSKLRGMSRTDSGVHARAQLVAFDASLEIPPRGWVLAMNSHLPDDVAVREARAVPEGFHPRFAAKRKRYAYRLHLDRVRDPLRAPFVWRVGGELDLALMREEAATLEGTHAFAAFRSAGDGRENTERTLTRVAIDGPADGELRVVVEGSAFLYNMVRIIVGTLVDIGRHHRDKGTMARALAERDRGILGTTAPPTGLCLDDAELTLPENCGEPWPL